MTDAGTELRERIERLEVLPTTVAVALRCIELGKDPDADIDQYAELIETDAALSSKVLAVTNSSWFGVRRKAVTVKQAVGLLGTASMRALAVSNCLAGLHTAWRLEADDARAYWEASLCKAIAARLVAQATARARADEAFTMGLFQDIGIGLFAAVAGAEYSVRLRSGRAGVEQQLADETERFGLDHADAGRLIGERLGLPEPYLSAIGFHHHRPRLNAAAGDEAVATAGHLAALLPHDIRGWHADAMIPVDELLRRELSAWWPGAAAFVAEVQRHLRELIGMFSLGAAEAPSLTELIQQACIENVRNTAQLIAEKHALQQQTRTLGGTVQALRAEQQSAAERAAHDPLTGLLTRDAFLERGRQTLRQAGQTPGSATVAVFDIDGLQRVNLRHGHACGDAVLQTLGQRLRGALRRNDIAGRWGGDEFVVLMLGLPQDNALPAAERIQAALHREPVAGREGRVTVGVSGGVYWTADAGAIDLQGLVQAADEALYQAKVLYEHGLVLATAATPPGPCD
ncbi:MAG: HDOD domain-containing protein [Planctomycetota bacterium]